ncbi:MAG: DNA polymerase III subunit delta [Anaerolineae bacterium]
MSPFYLFHGENMLEQEEALASLLEGEARDEFADLNTERLSPPVALEALQHACDTLPFLGGRRVVIVKQTLKRAGERWLKDLVAYLPKVPSSTLLVFLENEKLPARHPVLKLAKQEGAEVRYFGLPDVRRDLPHWVQKRVARYGGQIEPAAVGLLVHNFGARLRQLDQEIQKLLLYHGGEGQISVKDVRRLVPYVQSADVIFALVDALGKREPRTAAHHLHRLLDVGEHPLGIFGMIARQYRLLIQVRWLSERAATEEEIAKRLSLHPFVAKKTRSQATFFTHEQLKRAYEILTENDLLIKTGRLTPEAALDLLVAQLTEL